MTSSVHETVPHPRRPPAVRRQARPGGGEHPVLALRNALGNQGFQRALQRVAAPDGVTLREADEESDTEMQVYSDTGRTNADVTTGKATIQNMNPTCAKPCTQKHEQTHVADISPCLKEANRAWKAATDAADKDRIVKKFQTWMKVDNAAALECRAYGAGVACNDAMWDRKKCGTDKMAKADEECCTSLSSYRSAWEGQRIKFCAASGGAGVTACPFPEPIEPSALESDLEDQPWRRPWGPPPIF